MWIIPKNLQLSSGAPDTAGFISDLNEQSQICASSLMVRSKPSQPRIWSQKWKRDSWTQHLSGRILRPSHAKPFEIAWTCLWPVIPASPSAQQASVSEPKTLATSGRTSQEQLELFALDFASSRMSKDTSPSDSEKSLESWNKLVTRRRGEYSARVKSARLTNASGSSSWPTIRASEYKDVGPVGSKSHDHMLGKGYLCAVVTQDAANWPTPCAMEAEKAGLFDKGQMGQSLSAMANRGELSNWPTPDASNHRDGAVLRTDNNLEQGGFHGVSLHHAMTKYGQAAPANHSTLGNRQELWLTPRANEPDSDPNFVARNADRGAHCHGTLSSQAKHLWPTITAHTPDMESNGPNGHSGTYLTGAVKQWATPQLQDGHNIVQDSTSHKTIPAQLTEMKASGKLNPRWVETLMGLPVGWVMPSCVSPVTIELTNCDSSATASSPPPPNELFEPSFLNSAKTIDKP